MRRTILFVHPSDELYGSDRCLLDIIQGLPAGDRAIVALPIDLDYAGELSAELDAAGATVERVDMLVLRRSALGLAQIGQLFGRFVAGTMAVARLIRRHDVDIVHSNTVAVTCGASAAMVTGNAHVWHVHEHIGDEPLLFRMLIRLMLSFFPGRIIANSRPVARALIGGSGRLLAKTRVVENSVDPTITPVDQPANRSGPVVIGVVGRLSPRKGIAEALEAAGLLAQRSIPFEMRFAGDVPPGRDDLREAYLLLRDELDLASRVTFIGQVDDIRARLQEFDILLLPSQRPEPFGLVVIEGMAAGLPVVATLNGGGSDDILDHGKTGFYCGCDPASIAHTLATLVASPGVRLEVGEAAVRVARNRYSPEHYRSGVARVYDSLSLPVE